MMLFLLDMAAYLITLLGAMAMLAFAAWKSASYGPQGVIAIMLLVPFACWGMAWMHWHAYDSSKALALRLAPVLAQQASQWASELSEFVVEGVAAVQSVRIHALSVARALDRLMYGKPQVVVYAQAHSYRANTMSLARALRNS